jgi:hypothetical protein
VIWAVVACCPECWVIPIHQEAPLPIQQTTNCISMWPQQVQQVLCACVVRIKDYSCLAGAVLPR